MNELPRIRHEGHIKGLTIFPTENACPKCGREMYPKEKGRFMRCDGCGHLETRKKTRKWQERAGEGT